MWVGQKKKKLYCGWRQVICVHIPRRYYATTTSDDNQIFEKWGKKFPAKPFPSMCQEIFVHKICVIPEKIMAFEITNI